LTTAAPRDRVLTWILPLLPAVVALVLLVLSLLLAEIIVAKELEQRADTRFRARWPAAPSNSSCSAKWPGPTSAPTPGAIRYSA
jgi:hypothetical protein